MRGPCDIFSTLKVKSYLCSLEFNLLFRVWSQSLECCFLSDYRGSLLVNCNIISTSLQFMYIPFSQVLCQVFYFSYSFLSSLKQQLYLRAYIYFKMPEDVIEFAVFFAGLVFVNEKGNSWVYTLNRWLSIWISVLLARNTKALS